MGAVGVGSESPFRSPPFAKFFGSAVTANAGFAISAVSVNWIVYHYTQSALDVSYLGLTGIVPGIVLGLLAGVVADRYNRRNLMVTADVVRMAAMGFLTIVLLLVGFSLLLTLATMILINGFSALFTPAAQAITPRLVPNHLLEDANGVLQAATGVVWSVGSAAGGILVVALGAVWGLGFNTLTYALSALLLLQIARDLGTPGRRADGARTSFRTDFADGWRYVVGHRSISWVAFGYLPSNFLSSFVSPYFVVYAATRFGSSAYVYGGLAASLAAGIAVGSVVVGRVRVRRIAGVVMGFALMAEAAFYGVLGLSQFAVISGLAALGVGLCIGFSNTVYYSTMQAVVPGQVLGRVLSIGDFGSFVAIPAGLLAGGLVILRYGVGAAILTAAVGILIVASILLASGDFRAFGDRTAGDSD